MGQLVVTLASHLCQGPEQVSEEQAAAGTVQVMLCEGSGSLGTSL